MRLRHPKQLCQYFWRSFCVWVVARTSNSVVLILRNIHTNGDTWRAWAGHSVTQRSQRWQMIWFLSSLTAATCGSEWSIIRFQIWISQHGVTAALTMVLKLCGVYRSPWVHLVQWSSGINYQTGLLQKVDSIRPVTPPIHGVLCTTINTSQDCTLLCQLVIKNYYVVQTFPLVPSARA